MTIIRDSHAPGKSTELRGPTFTGDVWADPVFASPELSINNIMFTPCARTHWHHHEGGQVLKVTAGGGWICDKGGEPQRLGVGDVVYAPAGTVHWHGADEGSYMLHMAISLGKTTWYDAVDEKEYGRRDKSK
jgi:quercetin dioxygenase-like cupin family protein